MPIKRGHIAPHNTYIVTLIRNFDSQGIIISRHTILGEKFIVVGATLPLKPIIYCSDGLCDLLQYSKSQIMLKSSSLSILCGPETSVESMEALVNALNMTNETEVQMILYSRQSNLNKFYLF